MVRTDADPAFTGVLCHAYAYSMLDSLSKLFGQAQIVFLHTYAETLENLLQQTGGEFRNLLDNFKTLSETMKEKGCADLRMEEMGANRVKLIVDNCSMAEAIHSRLGIVGSTRHLCPMVTMAVIAMVKERGFKKGDNIFDYVSFNNSISHMTENGAETELIITKNKSPKALSPISVVG